MHLENIKQLDGVRTLAITLVLICHFFTHQIGGHVFYGTMKFMKYLTFWTWSGVDLFFVLSGFLIGRILIFNKTSRNYFKAFYLRRLFRIFPAYYLVLLAFVLFLASGLAEKFPFLASEPFPMYTYFFYIQNIWGAYFESVGPHWLSVTWSLALEEQFYLILPLVIYFIRIKNLPKLLVICIILAPIVRVFSPGLDSYVLLPARMDSLLMGVLIGYYHLNGSIAKYFTSKQVQLKFLLVGLFLLVFICGLFEDMGGVFIHTVLTFLYGAILILVLVSSEKSRLVKLFSNSVMSFIAKISYMIYLTHQIFSSLLHQILLNQDPKIDNYKSALVTILALAITVLFSTISFYLFEKPILGLGKKFNY